MNTPPTHDPRHIAIPKPRPVAGWFESSWDLQQGLAVSELPDRDGAAAALWFSALDGACQVSACLQ